MNKYKNFIKNAYNGKFPTMGEQFKSEILKHFPEFGDDIKVGDYVIGKNLYVPNDFRLVSSLMGDIVRYNDPNLGEGENNGSSIRFLRKATPDEVAKIQEEQIKEGDWVHFSDEYPALVVVPPKGEMAYGLSCIGEWIENFTYWSDFFRPKPKRATTKEVESRLAEEAVKRGFKKGIIMRCIEGAIGTEAKFRSDPEFKYNPTLDRLDAHFGSSSFTVYSKGKWATPIETITKEEAEKLLGKIIK